MMYLKLLLTVVFVGCLASSPDESGSIEPSVHESLKSDDVIVSKDNIIPILRTIVLAFTQKDDPAYTGVVEATGEQLYKLAQKHAGDDKHISGFLKLIKKTVKSFSNVENLSDEQNKQLGELAEQYLIKHKFTFQFPESLLLHQAEMEQFVEKDDEVSGRSEKPSFDFSPYITALRDFTDNVKVNLPDLSKLPKMPEMPSIPLNLDRIGTAIDEYLPSIRSGALSGVGLSAGSLGMLAAAGILMTSAPFVLGLGGIGRNDDEEDFYYTNRRVSGGRRPLNQFLVPPPIQEPQAFLPAWMQEPEPQQASQFSHQQTFHQPQEPSVVPEADVRSGDEYEQYLQEYNDWVAEYQKALSEGQVSEEAKQYYHQYKEWFANYYRQQFGEDPPTESEQAPNVYSDNSINNIIGMVPPPPPQHAPVEQVPQQAPQTFVPSQTAPVDQQVEESNILYQTLPDREPTSNFQVIVVDDEKTSSPTSQSLPTPSQQVQHVQQVQQPERVPSFVRQRPVVTGPSFQQAANQPLLQDRLNQQAYQSFVNQQRIRQQQQQRQQQIQQQQQRQQQIQEQQHQQQQIQQQQQHAAAQEHIAKVQPQYRPEIIPQHSGAVSQSVRQPQPTPQIVRRPQFIPQRPVHVKVDQQDSQSPKIETGFRPLAGEEHSFSSSSQHATQQNPRAQSPSVTAYGSSSRVTFEGPVEGEETAPKSTIVASAVTSSALRTVPASTPASATTPTPVVFQRPKFETSVRVVTSKSVVTSAPFVRPTSDEDAYEGSKTKKRLSLDEILRSRGSQVTAGQRPKKFEAASEKKVEEKEEVKRVENKKATSVEEHVDNDHEYVESENRRTLTVVEEPANSLNKEDLELEAEQKDELPVYALDPFYGPRLSRIDVIFSQLSVQTEGCRQQAVCNIYKNPNAFTPLSDFLSRQLTVTVQQLKRPVSKDARIIRFFAYLQAARAGQDGYDCAEHYKDCSVDTAKLSYKPIVDAYNKISVLMNSS